MDTSLLITGGVMAAAGTILFQLKSIPVKIFRKVKQQFIYTVKVYQYDDLFEVLESWLSNKHEKHYRDVEATLNQNLQGSPPPEVKCDKDPEIKYKQEENTFIIRYLGKKIVISKNKEKIDKASSLKDIWFRKYTITGFKAKKQIDALLNEALEYSKRDKDKNSIKVYSNNQYGDWYNGGNVKVKPLDKTILNSDKKDFITKDIDEFLCSEEWYTNTNIAFKRGYCLYGPPGTGKTTLALAIANYTKRGVFCLNLNSFENDSRLPRSIGEIPGNSILLIEDIDKVFSGRENVNADSKITFSSLLNCLDGAFYKHGLITIITTNHIEKLDEALLRSGRMDVKIEIPLPTGKEVSEYLSLFYNQDIDISTNYKAVNGNFKMSDIQEICIRNRSSFEDAYNELGCNFQYQKKQPLEEKSKPDTIYDLAETKYDEKTGNWTYKFPVADYTFPKQKVNEQY